MELIGHVLWTNLFSKFILKKQKEEIKNSETIFWGIFPDIVSFGPLIIFLILNYFNLISYSFIFDTVSFLYNFTHSFIFFFLSFFVLFLITKKFYYESLGWFFHIFIDIFTHSKDFYATKFLWPVSDYGFNGISWRNIYFLIINYLVLFLIYGLIYLNNKKSLRFLFK